MELDRKPGSRDGKPSKTTRRKARQEGKKEDSIELQGTGDQPADPESGLVPGVTYSINKGRRWELVEQLKEASLEGEKRNTGQSEEKEEKERLESGVLVVEVRPEGHYYDSNQLNARLNPRAREKKEEDNEEPEMIKTRRGPEPKQNAPKKKDKTNQTCDDAPYNPDRKFVVTHKPGSKEVRHEKCLSRDGQSGQYRCRCVACRVNEENPRVNKHRELLKDAGLK